MALLYANENLEAKTVQELRRLGHDVLTSLEAGQANLRVPDPQVLAFATAQGRAVVTHNRRDFARLHRRQAGHAGIILCTDKLKPDALAQRIHNELQHTTLLAGRLVTVTGV